MLMKKTTLKDEGLLCAAIGCLISLSLFIFSLPGVGGGVWYQSETTITMLHASAFLSLFGVLFSTYKNTYILSRLLAHPLVFLPLMIGIVSLLSLPFQGLPLRHFLGSVRLGEGCVWWFDIAALSMGFLLLLKFPLWRKRIAWMALLSFVITYVLAISYRYTGQIYSPYYFSDFLAFQVIAVIPIILMIFKLNLQNIKHAAFLLFALALIMIFTHNKVAIIYILFGYSFFVLLGGITKWPQSRRSQISILAVCSLPFLVVILYAVLLSLPFESGFYNIYDSEVTKILRTVISRAYLAQTVLEPLLQDPFTVFTGLGWGSFVEHITYNLPLEWLDLTREKKQWDGVFLDHFHSHNMFIEVFYSAGILALVLFLGYIFSVLVVAKKAYKTASYIVVAGIACLISFWFLVPLSVPFIILSFAFMARFPYALFKNTCPTYVGRFVVLSVLLMQAGAVFVTFFTSENTFAAPITYQTNTLQALEECPLKYNDFGAGGIHLAYKVNKTARHLILTYEDSFLRNERKKSKAHASVEEGIPELHYLYCQLNQYKKQYKTTIRVDLTQLMTQGEVLLSLSPLLEEHEKAYYYKNWTKNIKAWLAKYPKRSDIAVPYLLWHLLNGAEAQMVDVANMIYIHDTEDPVGLWFKGIYFTGIPDKTQQGLLLMRRALKNDIERFMPVDETLKAQLLAE